MSPPPLKYLIDEDLSPVIAQHLRQEGIDGVHVRDRARLGATDSEVFALAYNEDRVLITANVADFEKLAARSELHGGLILIEE